MRILRRRVVLAMLGAALAVAVALPAWATKVVDVRLGRHVAFTRIVFELDKPAGYRIERNEPAPGISELVVTLDALAAPRVLTTKNSLVEGVTMEPRGPQGSLARIRLTKDGLRLKEMILASPPRIVLDILSNEPQPIATATPAKSTSSASPPKSASAAAAERTAETAAARARQTMEDAKRAAADKAAKERAAAEKAAAARAEAAARRAAAARAAAAEPAPAKPNGSALPDSTTLEIPSAGAANLVPGESGSAETVARERARREAAAHALAEAMGNPPQAAGDTGADALELDTGEAQELAMLTPDHRPTAIDPTPAVSPPGARPVTSPARTAQGDSGGFGGTALWAVAGFVLVGGGVMWLRRRRRRDFDDEDAEDGNNPFAGLDSGDQVTDGGDYALAAESGRVQAGGGAEGGPTSFELDRRPDTEVTLIDGSDDSDDTDQSNLFSQASPTEGDANMDSISSDFELGSSNPAPAMGAGLGDEVTALIRELERRVQSLETRLDEVVDSKERLERQVVAQTEELRVQRAAIARTQRAVRNMVRPEDETSATEPALRNPDMPPS